MGGVGLHLECIEVRTLCIKNIKNSILNNTLKGGGVYQIKQGVSNREAWGGGTVGLQLDMVIFYFKKLLHFI